MADDARISTALPRHPKTVKLFRRLGAPGCWHLVCLFLWVADNRADGNLEGMSDEDIEIAAAWDRDLGQFTAVLDELHFLDGSQGSRSVHDWAEHNPWAATRPQRIESAKRAAAARWNTKAGTEAHATSMRGGCESAQCAMPSSPLHSTPPKEERTLSSNPDGSDQIVKTVFDYYLERTNRNPKTYEFTPTRKKKAIARLKECLRKTGDDPENAEELMKLAIDGLISSDWHMGRDPKTGGKKYCEWEDHLFGSYERMESWWNRVPQSPVRPNGHADAEVGA